MCAMNRLLDTAGAPGDLPLILLHNPHLPATLPMTARTPAELPQPKMLRRPCCTRKQPLSSRTMTRGLTTWISCAAATEQSGGRCSRGSAQPLHIRLRSAGIRADRSGPCRVPLADFLARNLRMAGCRADLPGSPSASRTPHPAPTRRLVSIWGGRMSARPTPLPFGGSQLAGGRALPITRRPCRHCGP